MLLPFLYTLRALGVPVGTHEWLSLMKALSQNQAHSSIDRFYFIARSLLVKSERLYDAYDQAFLICFQKMTEKIDFEKEILNWLETAQAGLPRPELPDVDPLTLEALRRELLERLKKQKERHDGGNYWIGTGGTSPFGHSGAHPSGIRIGGPGGGRMAVKIAEERHFSNYREDRILNTRQFKVALKKLRKLERIGAAEEFSMEESIQATCKNAGEVELVFKPSRKNQTELILLMDVGGSMDMHTSMVEELFSAAHASKHFKLFRFFYFHNCIYSKLYTNMVRKESISTEHLFKQYRTTAHVIVVGDACMNPYELFAQNGQIDYFETEQEPGILWLSRIKKHFPNTLWLNPELESYWNLHPTIQAISELIPMYPLSLEGLNRALTGLK